MHVHKPDTLLLLFGYSQVAAKPVLNLSLALVCNADQSLVEEADAWQWLSQIFTEQPFDLGEKKYQAGFGVMGQVYPPAGAREFSLRAGVADLSTQLILPQQSVQDLGPLPPQSPLRTQYLGDFNALWLKKEHPWLPTDTDPRWFNRFREQQCRTAYWQGNETWFVEHMHPQHALVQGQLPGLRPRLLIRFKDSPQQSQELPLDLDTLWLMPNEQRTVMVYRAQIQVAREDAQDVHAVAAFLEHSSQPAQTQSELESLWQTQTESEAQPLMAPAVFSASELAEIEALKQRAAEQAADFNTEVNQLIDHALEQGQQQIDQHLQAAGIDPNTPANTATQLAPVWSEVPVFTAPADPNDYAQAIDAHIEATLDASQKQFEAYMEQQGFDMQELKQRAQDVQNNSAAAAEQQLFSLLSTLPFKGINHQEYLQRYQAFTQEMAEMRAQLTSQFMPQPAATEPKTMAPDLVALGLPTGPRTVLTRAQLEQYRDSEQQKGWLELRDQNLAGLDLSGLNLTASVFIHCDLSQANLSQSNLEQTLFKQCQLTAVNAQQAQFKGAYIEQCDFTTAQLNAADFSASYIQNTCFNRVQAPYSVWVQAKLIECELINSQCQQAQAFGLSIENSVLTGAHFQRAQLNQVDVVATRLDGAVFNAAQMQEMGLLNCQGTGADFSHAFMVGFRSLDNTQLDGANFSWADLSQASLQHSDLSAALLRQTTLKNALVRHCNLHATHAWCLDGRATDFGDSILSAAQWQGANLMHATFAYARLVDVDLSHSNLHGASLRTAYLQGLQLHHALLTRCDVLQEYDNA